MGEIDTVHEFSMGEIDTVHEFSMGETSHTLFQIKIY